VHTNRAFPIRAVAALAAIAALASSCTRAEREAATAALAAAPAACTLVAVFAGNNGPFAGTLCEDVASLVANALARLPQPHPSRAPCPKLEPVRDAAGREVGYMCPAFVELANGAIRGAK
jgi:hypothetical protein